MAPLRILAVSISQEYGNDYAFVRAFRRAGHSVTVVSPDHYLPLWQSRKMRVVRRALNSMISAEFNQALLQNAEQLKPDILFVYKGHFVFPETLDKIRKLGTIAINVYPDVGFEEHGPNISRTINGYDWVFSTKTHHPEFLKKEYDFNSCSFIPHCFNPEIHYPFPLDDRDLARYECDVSFIGNSSTKKIELIGKIADALPDLKIRIWGPERWEHSPKNVRRYYQGSPVFGVEYAKAIRAAKITLGMLLEEVKSAGVGDVITARTFEIPASGGFMLHERTDEVIKYFEEGKECAFYGNVDELVEKIRYYLANEDERKKIAEAGYRRSLSSGYSVDDRAQLVLEKYHELKSAQE